MDVKSSETKKYIKSRQAEDLTLKSPRELVQTFIRLQEMRVQIFDEFRQSVVQIGLSASQENTAVPCILCVYDAAVLQTGSGIRDSFSAVSEQINCIEKLMHDEKQQGTIAQLLRKIQVEEKEKLFLTSALLIEEMRLSDAVKQHELDDSTIAFLGRSVKTLTTKHTDCVVRINEILEELQAEIADLEDA